MVNNLIKSFNYSTLEGLQIFRIACIALLLHFICSCSSNGGSEDTIPFADALQEANVTLSKMQDGQSESLMLGNGDLYGIIWEKDGSPYMRITKNDIWDARLDTSKDQPLPKVDIASGKVTGSSGAPPSYDLPYPHPRCAAVIKFGSAAIGGGMLDLQHAVASLGETKVRVLSNSNVVLINTTDTVTIESVSTGISPAEQGTDGAITWLHQKLAGDENGDWQGMEYALALAVKGNVKVVSLVSSYDIKKGNVRDTAIALARESIQQEERVLIAQHEQRWNQYWSRSGIQLDDKVMEKWWYRMLYFAKTVCEPGNSPVALMPPLATNVTPWHADLHHNYNAWQAFWPLPASNQPELVDPWISYNHDMIPRFKWLAKETYGIDGLHVPISSYLHEPDPALSKSNNNRQMSMNPWGLTIGLQGMTLQSMWQKYLCDQDQVYMKEKIYPFAKEVVTFYTSFMAECKKDEQGKILLGPSYSPEHGGWGIYNCPFDIAYVHYAFDAFIQASSDLGMDQALAEKCRTYKNLLGPYPTNTIENGQTIVVDWQGANQIAVHNITVPVSPIFPADQVTWFSPEEEKNLFKRTIKATRFNGNNSHVMFNIAKARLSLLDGYTDGKEWFASRELPNGFFKWQGHQHGTYMAEMIGVVGLINEYLMQSVGNKIRLFPCWPEDKDAAFTRLRAQGGFIVSAAFKDGRVESATLESVADKQLQLLSPWKTIYVNGEKSVIDASGLVTFNTKPGEVFVFTETH